MNKYLFEVMQEVAKAKKKTDKVSILKQNETWALKDIIRGSMDKTVKWSLPDGEPPYTPAESHNHPTDLRRQNVMFMDTPKFKKERMFLEMIEGVHPEDAKLVIGMINKETPKGITRAVVEEAYPGLLQD